MNLFDLIVLASVAGAVIGGFRLGFLARVASWVGLAIGLFLAVQFLPTAIESFQGPDPTRRLLIAFLVLVGGALIGQAAGLVAGTHLRKFVAPGPLRTVDRAIGGFVGGAGVLLSVWLLLPTMTEIPGWPSQQARNSVMARGIDSLAPDPPDTLQALRRLVGENRFPRVFDSVRPAIDPGAPPASLALPLDVQRRVATSTVKVEGVACGRLQEGSGFAAEEDVVVTNAHVVAGQRRTEVIRNDGKRLRGTVIMFDPDRDLALLSVPGLDVAPLGRSSGKARAEGAVFGHPNGQDPLRIAAARIDQRVDALGRDLYDRHTTRRDVFILAADLRPGDSGGALVDPGGRVMGVAFAIAPDRPGTSYALTSQELAEGLAEARNGVADTGPCLSSG